MVAYNAMLASVSFAISFFTRLGFSHKPEANHSGKECCNFEPLQRAHAGRIFAIVKYLGDDARRRML